MFISLVCFIQLHKSDAFPIQYQVIEAVEKMAA